MLLRRVFRNSPGLLMLLFTFFLTLFCITMRIMRHYGEESSYTKDYSSGSIVSDKLQISMKSDTRHRQQPLTVIYRDLSHCSKPNYLPDYEAHCWGKCVDQNGCGGNITSLDISQGRAYIRCFENFHLIGVRKCGTTDISHKWFLNTPLRNKWGTRGFHSGVSFLLLFS